MKMWVKMPLSSPGHEGHAGTVGQSHESTMADPVYKGLLTTINWHRCAHREGASHAGPPPG